MFVYKAILLFTNSLETEKNLCISAKFDNSSDMTGVDYSMLFTDGNYLLNYDP